MNTWTFKDGKKINLPNSTIDPEVRRELDHLTRQILILQRQIDQLNREISHVRSVASGLEMIR